ncbi:MAG: hypothetical protein AAF573_14345 [Bacteroidota bacterium]
MPSSTFDRNVFINCPFDTEYKKFLDPMLFTIVYLGLKPQMAQTTDSGAVRIDRIINLIRYSKYSIHDLSRMVAKKAGDLARFNMPFELGLDIGIRSASKRSRLSTKRNLIVDTEKFRYQKALSDLSGNDIQVYGQSPERLVLIIRNWLTTILHPKQPSGSIIWEEYNEFQTYFEKFTAEEGYDDDDLETLPINELIYLMSKWVVPRIGKK